jgi:hypothetical protein
MGSARAGLALGVAGGLDVFATANARLWRQIARDDPQPWKHGMSRAADAWLSHRRPTGTN